VIASILRYLSEQNIEVLSYDENQIITKHKINDIEFEIIGITEPLKSNSLPHFFLKDRRKYDILAHVGWDKSSNIGLMCSGSKDELSINYNALDKVYYEALLMELKMLQPIINDKNENYKQSIQEYLGHLDWVEDKTKPILLIMASPLDGINELIIRSHIQHSVGINKKIIVTTKDYDNLSKKYCLVENLKSIKRQTKTQAFMLKIDNIILPPTPYIPIAQWWLELLAAQTTDFLELLRNHLVKIKSKTFWFVCHFEFENDIFWFAVYCENERALFAPIVEKYMNKWNFSILKVDIHSKHFLLPRAGGKIDFQDKKVMLVGCGSVGTHIANELVLSGIGELSLVDFDNFESKNLYRHTLSMDYDVMNKALAVSYDLQRKYPYTTITSFNKKLSDITVDELIRLDLIIIAIGDPTEERLLNEFMKNNNIAVPVIYTWLEGYGVGGHAVYVHSDISSGCLQCNYIDISIDEPILNSNMNFLYPNQNVTKDLGGCGTLYLPYSHLDAQQTSLMVTRLAIESLSNKLDKSVRVSWKGNSEDAKAMNLNLTHRYHRYQTNMQKEEYKQECCFVCN